MTVPILVLNRQPNSSYFVLNRQPVIVSIFCTEQAVGGTSYFGSEQAVGDSSYFSTEPAAGDSDSYNFILNRQ